MSGRDILDANYIWKNVRRTHAHTSCRSMGRALSQIQSILPPSFLCDSRTPDKPQQVINMTALAFLYISTANDCLTAVERPSSITIQSHSKIQGTLPKKVHFCDVLCPWGPSKRPFSHPDRCVWSLVMEWLQEGLKLLFFSNHFLWVTLESGHQNVM